MYTTTFLFALFRPDRRFSFDLVELGSLTVSSSVPIDYVPRRSEGFSMRPVWPLTDLGLLGYAPLYILPHCARSSLFNHVHRSFGLGSDSPKLVQILFALALLSLAANPLSPSCVTSSSFLFPGSFVPYPAFKGFLLPCPLLLAPQRLRAHSLPCFHHHHPCFPVHVLFFYLCR